MIDRRELIQKQIRIAHVMFKWNLVREEHALGHELDMVLRDAAELAEEVERLREIIGECAGMYQEDLRWAQSGLNKPESNLENQS